LRTYAIATLATLTLSWSTGCSLGTIPTPSAWLMKAEEASSSARYEDAIEAYRKHIAYRLNAKRPDWENPYFYELKIGDIHLHQSRPKKALEAYLSAWKHGVSDQMVSDRIRAVARWYERSKQLQKSFELLAEYRELDSLLFDSILDRIARQLSEQEASNTQPHK
jgi:tetratricopeptide (TPR) repeat protein